MKDYILEQKNLYLARHGIAEPKIKYSLKELSLNNDTSFLSPGKNTALHLAARMGDKSAVEELLNRNASLLTEKNIKGNTPLHLAARIGHVDVVEFLICHAEKLDVENGGVYEVISMRNMKDDTPLHEAVRGGHRSVTSLLVKKVVEANHSDLLASRNKAGECPFSMAIDLNYFEGIVRTFLDAEPSCLLHRGPNNQTPLHRAVFRADLDTVKILLEKKPGLIYEKDSYGRTPLHYAAASSGFLVWMVCGHLLKRDSSIALLQDHYQATPAHLAAECGRRKALITILNACPHSVELLNQHRQNILHAAAQNGSVMTVKCILSLREADDLINEPDKDGNTPLHLAAMNFHSSVVRCLALKRKVDIRAINNDGKTALDVAQDYKRNMTTKKSFIKAFLLKEDNFENWSIQMKTLLDSKSVWEVTKKGSQVPEDECKPSQTQRDYISDASKKDKQALSFIYQALDENNFEKISRANTAKEAWEIQEDGSYKTADKSLLQGRAMDTSSNEKDDDKIKENQKAMDKSSPEDDDDEDKINKTQFIIDILKAAYARRARNPKDILDRKKHASKQINGFKTRKEMAGAFILMATLIATVTFAAAFTIPGGFQAEDPHKGMVVLGRNVAFRTFIVTDTIAMTSSMMAALILIITPFQTDEEIIELFLLYSLVLLWLALMAMGIAFVTGLYAVLSQQLPLAIVVCCIGCVLPLIIYYGPVLIEVLQPKES